VIDNRINALSSSYVGGSRATLSAESPGSTAALAKLLPFASVLTKTGVRFGVSQSPTMGTDFWIIAGSTTLSAQLAAMRNWLLRWQRGYAHSWLYALRNIHGCPGRVHSAARSQFETAEAEQF